MRSEAVVRLILEVRVLRYAIPYILYICRLIAVAYTYEKCASSLEFFNINVMM